VKKQQTLSRFTTKITDVFLFDLMSGTQERQERKDIITGAHGKKRKDWADLGECSEFGRF